MSDQEKKQQRIYDYLNVETKAKKKKKIWNNWSIFIGSIKPRPSPLIALY